MRVKETELHADRTELAPSTLRIEKCVTVQVNEISNCPGRRALWASQGAPPGPLGALPALRDRANHLGRNTLPGGIMLVVVAWMSLKDQQKPKLKKKKCR